MNFSEMVAGDLPSIYAATGDDATVSIGGLDPVSIKVVPDDDMLVEYVEFSVFRAMASAVEGVADGDVLTINGTEKTILSVKSSDDGLEMYIGVDK